MLFKIIGSTISDEIGKYLVLEDFDADEIDIEGKKYKIDFVRKIMPGIYQFGRSNYIFLARADGE